VAKVVLQQQPGNSPFNRCGSSGACANFKKPTKILLPLPLISNNLKHFP
jgi:hypothetical protein